MRSSRFTRLLGPGVLAAVLVGSQVATVLAADPVTTLVPIGSDYQPDTLQLFAGEAAHRSQDQQVHILVLPISYSLSASGTTKSERKKNLTLADTRRGQVETACNAVKAADQSCLVELVPVLVTSDADAFDPAPWFTADLDGMFILGGDQTVAMNVVHDTPLERAMASAFYAGAVVGGNSAGDAVQSRDMINGYTGSNGPAESMRQGAVEVCHDTGATTCEGGLAFGFPNLITDQHVFEYGRTGRSLNVSLTNGKPVLGMDAATGAVVTGYTQLRDVTGDTEGYVIDPAAYGATHSFGGPDATLSARNVALHLLPPGSGFDFGTMTPSQGGTPIAKPSISGRTSPIAVTGGGPVFLSGGIVADPAGAVGRAFLAQAGGSSARIVVLAAGYAKNTDAQADAKAFATAYASSAASVSWFVLDARTKTADAVAAISQATGIVLTGRDRSLVKPQLQASPAWTAAQARRAGGAALLADDAGAAVVGQKFVAEAPVADVEAGAIDDAVHTTIADGLGLVGGLSVEPRLLPDQHWPQLFQLTAASGTTGVSAGIDVGTAIRVAGTSASVVGSSAAVVVDGRRATISRAANGAVAAAWLVVDSFVDGEVVAP